MVIPDKVLIVGLGATGIGVVRFLHKMGKTVTITDMKPAADLAPALDELQGISFTGHFGEHRLGDFLNHRMIVVSPGVDSEMPLLRQARQSGASVIGETELASAFSREPIIAITGTNGKTTTTTLTGEIFRQAFGNVFVGGNIGNPLINYVSEEKRARYIVLEVSSFQLETIETFHPNAAVLLNITEDHLDRYKSFQDYRDTKYRVFENQTGDDYAIIQNGLDTSLIPGGVTILPFSTDTEVKEGAFYSNGKMHVRLNGNEFSYNRNISPLVGIHNTENLLATLMAAHIYRIDPGIIEDVVTRFRGLPHRVEFVRNISGVTFYNDSKATNVDATKRALESMNTPVVLIAGGKDKGGSYSVIKGFKDRVRSLVLFGEAKEKIARELGDSIKTVMVRDLGEATATAYHSASEGDVVLFSPMCSSFDMFRDYKERGNIFKDMVEAL